MGWNAGLAQLGLAWLAMLARVNRVLVFQSKQINGNGLITTIFVL